MSIPRLCHKLISNKLTENAVECRFRKIYTSTFLFINKKYIIKKSTRLMQKNMTPICDSNLLSPPESIRGLKILDKTLFKKLIKVPTIYVGDVVISKIMPYIKKYLLKIENLKPLQKNSANEDSKYFLLNPMFVSTWLDIDVKDRDSLQLLGVTNESLKSTDLILQYENWRADELLKYILPDDKTSVAGFSKIGHIIHLNLRDHVIDYKQIIGEILLDKISGAKTVVNKLDKIDNTYRNFEMEVLCGESDMLVQVKENHCCFEFDFSTVYWNPRLSTEHERVTNMLKPGDVLYDIFAGVGPFAIPAAKKKCTVLANDLNPESFRWLNHNAKINKINDIHLKTFNKDGRHFIINDIKNDLKNRFVDSKNNIHITMNLPALATEFLNAFCNLYTLSEIESFNIKNFPTVHVYCFAKGEDTVQIARNLTESGLKHPLTDNLIGIYNVRKVSSNKEMMRVSFKLNRDILVESGERKRSSEENVSTDAKKLCHGEEQRKTESEKCVQSSGGKELKNQI